MTVRRYFQLLMSNVSLALRPSSIDRHYKRLGNDQARLRRHRIKRAVGPIRPRSFRVAIIAYIVPQT